MRREVTKRVAQHVGDIALWIEAVARELDDEDLVREDRRQIGRSLRIAEREIGLLQRYLKSLLESDTDIDSLRPGNNSRVVST
jgi:hypothetical protein